MHGTYAGAQRHYREGSPLCEPCRVAKCEYMRQLRRAKPDLIRLDKRRARIRLAAANALIDRHRDEFEEILVGIHRAEFVQMSGKRED